MGDNKKRKKKSPGLAAFDKEVLRQLPHNELIDSYLEQSYSDPEFMRKFGKFVRRKIDRDILTKYFIEGWTSKRIAQYYGISDRTISKFLTDYILKHYDDSRIEMIASLDADNHLGVLDAFFSSVLFVAKDAAMNAIVAKKLREQVALKMAQEGVLETAKDVDLMRAWENVSRKTERYAKLANEHMKTYLSLMERVLDKQRDVAMIRVLYDVLQRLEPTVAEKLMEALNEDEYARAVFQSLPGPKLMSVFQYRHNPDDFKTKLQRDAEKIMEAASLAAEIDIEDV